LTVVYNPAILRVYKQAQALRRNEMNNEFATKEELAEGTEKAIIVCSPQCENWSMSQRTCLMGCTAGSCPGKTKII